ncbi:coenzyme F420-0:L-glutamate ligase [Nocardioides oleivorans]|uniref:Coenzyme F420-0:L-glutamate ligase n=1 Tax=Nocardioides oleivorans TaxID=273676 RepID=A0A4Q2RWD9_9ACTN|nr:coenzyme F420-0:L-glutamate ligase [Nocardioides oleivorans]RYB93046.1 coenzyme F420-0:L-glutamate ligase [Nocardioides oleivorans]
MSHLEVWAPDGLPEVRPGDDLAGLVLGACDLRDGDVVSVTSKVVSKAEGRTRGGDREEAIDEESLRVLARRGPTRIVRHRLGLTMAAAGVDASNVDPGTIVLLPLDPDASARSLRRELLARGGVNVAVVVTDTAGRAWREGQTDIAIGAAGLRVAEDFAGRTDGYGNQLAVTLPAVADELAGAAELVQGKLGGRPVAVVRGRRDLVLPPGEDGPGATSLVRPEGADLFGWGAREAVVRALAGDDDDRVPFGARSSPEELAAALVRLPDPNDPTAVAAVRFAHGWLPADARGDSDCDGSPTTT